MLIKDIRIISFLCIGNYFSDTTINIFIRSTIFDIIIYSVYFKTIPDIYQKGIIHEKFIYHFGYGYFCCYCNAWAVYGP